MKLHKLTIHNIASIEDATIDFEQPPLSGSDVFLITGKTGSGKSTILDAISLALYGDTPRMAHTKMEGSVADGDKSTTIGDVRQLLRRGTGKGDVVLEFTGSNGLRYVATWGVRRAYDKADGTLQGRTWNLTWEGNRLTKDQEIRNEIDRAVGLSFDQFCRTTMLAQGDFTRFLNSKDEDKSEILEKITGTGIYTKIGQRLAEITSLKRRECDNAKLVLDNIQMLSDEQKEQLKAEQEERQHQCSLIDTELKTLGEKVNWIGKYIQLHRDIDDAGKNYSQAMENKDCEAVKSKSDTVGRWNATTNARQWVAVLATAKDEQKKRQQEIDNLGKEWQQLDRQLDKAQQTINRQQQKIAEIDAMLLSEEKRATIYEQSQTIVVHLNSIADSLTAIEKHSNDKATLENKLNQLQENQKSAQEGETLLISKIKECEEKQSEYKAKLQSENIDTLREQQNKYLQLLNSLEIASVQSDAYNKEVDRIASERKSLDNLSNETKKLEQQCEERKEALTKAHFEVESHKLVLERLEDSAGKWAVAIRAKLAEGDTCPVCGQSIDLAHLPHEEILSSSIKEAQDELKTAENKLEELKKKDLDDKATIKSNNEQYTRRSKNIDNASQENGKAQEKLNNLLASIEEKCAELGIGIPETDETGPKHSAIRHEAQSRHSAIESRLKELGEYEKLLNSLRDEEKKLSDDLEKARAKTSNIKDEISKHNQEIASAASLIKTKNDEINDKKTELSQLFGTNADMTKIKWDDVAYISNLASKIIDATNKYTAAVQEREKLKHKTESFTTSITGINTTLDKIRELHTFDTADSSESPVVEDGLSEPDFEALGLEAQNLLTKITSAKSLLGNAQKNIDENSQLVDNYLASPGAVALGQLEELCKYTPDEIARLKADVDKAHEDVTIAKSKLDALNKQLDDLVNSSTEIFADGEQTPDEAPEPLTVAEYEAIRTDLGLRISALNAKLSTFNQEIGACRKTLDDDQKQHEQHASQVEEYNRLCTIYDKWEHLNMLIGDSKGKTFRNIAQSYVLANLIHSANSYMSMLSDRYRLNVQPGSFVITVSDSFLSGTQRAASTLSGGESFLVSLALALALSDIGQKLAVDTLFIDEGFGTLSGEPLQNAITTLRSLHLTTGRHVGIISHIEELKERIPVQIQVNQESSSSKSTIDILPKQ